MTKKSETLVDSSSEVSGDFFGDRRSVFRREDSSDAASASVTPPVFRYYIKGEKVDFGVTDMVQLQQLYHSGFLGPNHLVRRFDSTSYRMARCIPELQVAEEKKWLEGNEVIVLAVLICVATLLMIFIFRLIP